MKLHRDLVVYGDPKQLSALRLILRDRADGDTWKQDPASAARFRERRSGGGRECDVFRYDGPDAPSARVFLFWENDHADIGNIVPCEQSSLTHDEYNLIAERFRDDVIAGPSADAGCRVELGPAVKTLEDVLPPEVLQSLQLFSDAANKVTGTAHPYDADRWDSFVILAHVHKVTLSSDLLHDWLVNDEGWGADEASTLVGEYDSARRVLASYDKGRS